MFITRTTPSQYPTYYTTVIGFRLKCDYGLIQPLNSWVRLLRSYLLTNIDDYSETLLNKECKVIENLYHLEEAHLKDWFSNHPLHQLKQVVCKDHTLTYYLGKNDANRNET